MIKDIIDKNENVKPNTSKIIKLKELIPNCFDRKGNLDIDLLKKEFNQDLNFTKESFELNFLGKSYAKMITGLDTETVIEPDIAHNNEQVNKNSENIYISGDNLDALKHLLKAYEGKIKCIYIDPPYNTGTDGFVYNDTFNFTKDSLIEKLDVSEEEADRIISMTSENSSSHSAWLTFMYPRLYLARNLLSENGIIFISIDDNEENNLKFLCDDLFGEENCRGVITVVSNPRGRDYGGIAKMNDYLLVYTKQPLVELNKLEDKNGSFSLFDEIGGFELRELRNRNIKFNNENRPNLYYPFFLDESIVDENGLYNIYLENKENCIPIYPAESQGIKTVWRWGKEKSALNLNKNIKGKKMKDGRYQIVEKYRDPKMMARSVWWDKDVNTEKGTLLLKEMFGFKVFDYPKTVEMIDRVIEMSTDTDTEDIVLDFFSGSATTAHSLLSMNSKDGGNRKFIVVQIPEKCADGSPALENGYKTIDQIGMKRIQLASEKIKEETNANIDYGFKHYTLKNTDNNLLNKLEQFKPQLINETYDLYKEYGIETIVETWKLKDGYEFTTPVKVIECAGYKIYKCEDSLYLIEPNINIDNIKALLEYYSSDDLFVCNKIVLFGYSFKFNELEMIKNNIKQVKNFKNIDVKVYTRY